MRFSSFLRAFVSVTGLQSSRVHFLSDSDKGPPSTTCWPANRRWLTNERTSTFKTAPFKRISPISIQSIPTHTWVAGSRTLSVRHFPYSWPWEVVDLRPGDWPEVKVSGGCCRLLWRERNGEIKLFPRFSVRVSVQIQSPTMRDSLKLIVIKPPPTPPLGYKYNKTFGVSCCFKKWKLKLDTNQGKIWVRTTVRCDELFSTATYANNLRFGKNFLGSVALMKAISQNHKAL